MIGPSPSVGLSAPARAKADRSHERHAATESVGVEAVNRPIDAREVRCIASRGYPLWEPLEMMQLRNRRITVAYSDLSEELAHLLAGEGGRLDANWCSFAAWSSRTIGQWIEDDVTPEPLQAMRAPRVVKERLLAVSRYLLQRENGASYRSLAAGNRFVFLEIGQAVAHFIEHFRHVPRDRPDEDAWRAYRARVDAVLDELSQLDISWMSTQMPPPDDLCLGLRQYYEAIFVRDPKQRAELVLAGNLLIGAYEQRRVQGYVVASLALLTERAMRDLVHNRTGAVTSRLRRLPDVVYARLMSRGLVLNVPGEQLKVGQPLPPVRLVPPAYAVPEPSGDAAADGEHGDGQRGDGDDEPGDDVPGDPLFPPDLRVITLPLLQALLTRWDLSEGVAARRRVRDWTSLDDRMSYITNLFRSRQHHPALFTRPFAPEVESELLNGRLA